MAVNKLFLSKNKRIHRDDAALNAFIYNESPEKGDSTRWFAKNIRIACDQTEDPVCFLVMDQGGEILKEVSPVLTNRRYYAESISPANGVPVLNPFHGSTEDVRDFIQMILSLFSCDDESDKMAMDYLLNAYAACMTDMFAGRPDMVCFDSLEKLAGTADAVKKDGTTKELMMDVLFDSINDQESMPCKYYQMFTKAAGEQKETLGKKALKFLQSLPDSVKKMMAGGEDAEELRISFGYKTAVFINYKPCEKKEACILLYLLNKMLSMDTDRNHVMVILDSLEKEMPIEQLPRWLEDADKYAMTYLIGCKDLAQYDDGGAGEKYFRNIQKNLAASVLIHSDAKDEKPTATVITSEFNEEDYLS